MRDWAVAWFAVGMGVFVLAVIAVVARLSVRYRGRRRAARARILRRREEQAWRAKGGPPPGGDDLLDVAYAVGVARPRFDLSGVRPEGIEPDAAGGSGSGPTSVPFGFQGERSWL